MNYVGVESDEMYTQYVDIVNELDHYPQEFFVGKRYCFRVIGMLFIIVVSSYD